jgi:hypothetical protein
MMSRFLSTSSFRYTFISMLSIKAIEHMFKRLRKYIGTLLGHKDGGNKCFDLC